MQASRRWFIRQVAGFTAVLLNACAAPSSEPPPAPSPDPTPQPNATVAVQPTRPAAAPTLLPAPTAGLAPTLRPAPAAVSNPPAAPLAVSDPTPAPAAAPAAEPTPKATPTPAIDLGERGQKRYIAGTGGVGVRLRAGCADEPSGPANWPEGAEVTVEHGRSDCPGWVFVTRAGDQSSWVRGQYLASAPAPTVAPIAQPGSRLHLETFDIGKSVRGRPLVVTRLGDGPVGVAFIGNIHGGWEPISRDAVDVGLEYFRQNPSEVDARTSLYFIPTMNPDGYEAGRPLWANANGSGGSGDAALANTAFNANGVDLNRNFGTNWTSDACGGERVRLTSGLVDGRPCRAGLGGSRAFSEPETQAYRDFILGRKIRWALTYHEDQSPAILIREGGGGASEPFAKELEKLFGYPYVPRTQAYRVTGHAWDWFDANGVLGAEIELEYRTLTRDRNLSAMKLAIRRATEPVGGG